MKVKCPECKKTINIKDGSFPTDRSFSFSCPGCKNRVKVSPENKTIKPVEKKEIKSNLNNDLYGEKLKKEILSSNTSLPPVPQVLTKTKEILNNPHHTTKDLGKIISLDQGIAARVLKLANSAYFCTNPPIPTIEEACIILGESNLMSIIMVAEMSKMLDKELNGYDIPTGNLFYHSIFVAVASHHISNEKMPLLDQDSFSAGLLHDCGKILLNSYIFNRKDEFRDMVKDHQVKCYEAETVLLGFSHADIGFNLLESWKLPEIQTHAIGFHHHPGDSGGNELAYILNAADYMAIKAGYAASTDCYTQSPELNEEVMEYLELDEEDIDYYINDIKDKVEEMTQEFKF